MKAITIARRLLFSLAIAALVAGCATPQESGPTDLNTDNDRNGIPDDTDRDQGNVTANDTMGPTITPAYGVY